MQPGKSVVRYRVRKPAVRSDGRLNGNLVARLSGEAWRATRQALNDHDDADDAHREHPDGDAHGGTEVSRLRPADAPGARRAARRQPDRPADVRVPPLRRGIDAGRLASRLAGRAGPGGAPLV